ncbi:hypothetical protein MNBD_GAMMA08-597 [hydrothermal vent metagenome]|uniref:Lipoprotein LPP20-like domain-containing protein n=1 Tax=hydrothermal vent metagenome TaxID=652676 RepID=A0A3B0X402_9ZZZZ
MKNIILLAAGLTVSAFLIGCGSEPKKEVVADCVFPDAPDMAAPSWICDEPVPNIGIDVYAVGSADKSAAGNDFMKQMAATSARVQLAQRMKVKVNNMIKQYVETTGAADTETVDKVLTSVTKQVTSETLVGSKIYKTRYSPKGNIYVLLGIDPTNVAKISEAALKSSMKNERALWQQFKAKNGQDELAADIAKLAN